MSSSVPKTLETETPSTPNSNPPNEIETQKTQTSTESNPPLDSETLEDQTETPSDQSNVSINEENSEAEDEEEGECGFCLFMKGGGCKERFIDWENCIKEAEKNKDDIVEKCFETTELLKKCMEAHSDYYEPVLRAEKAVEEEADNELEREAVAKAAKQDK